MSGEPKDGIRLIPNRDASNAEIAEICKLWKTVWPDRPDGHFERKTSNFANTDPGGYPCGYLVLQQNDASTAQCMIFPRTIKAASGEITVMALGGVCVDPSARGNSLGRKIVEAAFSYVDTHSFVLSLFQTSFRVEPFYLKLGCRRIENSFINSLAGANLSVEEKKRSVFWDDVVMVYPADAHWPKGEIDLQGNAY